MSEDTKIPPIINNDVSNANEERDDAAAVNELQPIKVKFTYLWKIENCPEWFDNKKTKVSPPFSVDTEGKVKATVIASLTDTDDYLSLYLRPEYVGTEPFPIEIFYKFSLVNRKREEFDVNSQTMWRKDIFIDSYAVGFRTFATLRSIRDRNSQVYDDLWILCNVESTVNNEDKIKFNDYNSYHNMFEAYLHEESLSDFKFVSHERVFNVHRAIIGATFKFFDEEVLENNSDPIPMDSVEPDVLENMLLFAYSGKLEQPCRHLKELFTGAISYEATDLTKTCEYLMQKDINVQNVVDYLIFADSYGLYGLMSYCMAFIVHHSSEIIKANRLIDFVNTHPALFQKIIDEYGKKYKNARTVLTNFFEENGNANEENMEDD